MAKNSKPKRKMVGSINIGMEYHTFSIYEDEKIIKEFFTTIEELPEKVVEFAQLFKVKDIRLFGSKSFLEDLAKKIKSKEITSYRSNRLKVTIEKKRFK